MRSLYAPHGIVVPRSPTRTDGSLDVFFGGLESLLGPPQVVKDPEDPNHAPTIRKSMENEHTACKDSKITFTSSNGVTTDSAIEWEFAYRPEKGFGEYPERERLEKEEYRRKPKPLAEFLEEGGLLETEANARLRAEGHSEVILEELLAGRLYTGPMCKQISSSHPNTAVTPLKHLRDEHVLWRVLPFSRG